jgi:hypothetical protein
MPTFLSRQRARLRFRERGELRKLGIDVSATLVRNAFKAASVTPATQRGQPN